MNDKERQYINKKMYILIKQWRANALYILHPFGYDLISPPYFLFFIALLFWFFNGFYDFLINNYWPKKYFELLL